MEEHFRITADVRSVQAAAKSFHASLEKMRLDVVKLQAQMLKGFSGPTGNPMAGFSRGLVTEIQKSVRSLNVLGDVGTRNAKRVTSEWAKATLQMRNFGTAARTAAMHANVPRPRTGGHPGSPGGYGLQLPPPNANGASTIAPPSYGAGAARRGVGQSIGIGAAASMLGGAGLMSVMGIGATLTSGIRDSIERAVSDVTLSVQASRRGLSGSSFISAGQRATRGQGADYTTVNALVGRQMQMGETNADRAGANARLALDMEAAGGSASGFIEALTKNGPEAAAAIKQMSEDLGVKVRPGDTLQQMISELEKQFGGLAAQTELARGSFGAWWEAVKKSLSDSAGGGGALSQTFQKHTAWMEGDEEKSGFINRQQWKDFFGIKAQREGDGSLMGRLNSRPGRDKRFDEFRDMRTSALERLNELSQSGQLTGNRRTEMRDNVLSAFESNDYGKMYDYSQGRFPGVGGGDAGVDTRRASAVPNHPLLRGPSFDHLTPEAQEFRFVVTHNPGVAAVVRPMGF